MGYSVAIVGYGALGSKMHLLFPDALTYDEHKDLPHNARREDVNRCDYALVCVPTPPGPMGRCDDSIVEDVLWWLRPAKCTIILSTIGMGSMDRFADWYPTPLVFSPEYTAGDVERHPYGDPRNLDWVVLGGKPEHTRVAAELYAKAYDARARIFQTDARTAVLVKQAENAYLALKVTFCNELYDIAKAHGIDYNEFRELWLLDERMGRSHTLVYPDQRGYGGKCLPKDVGAMIYDALMADANPQLLRSMRNINEIRTKEDQP